MREEKTCHNEILVVLEWCQSRRVEQAGRVVETQKLNGSILLSRTTVSSTDRTNSTSCIFKDVLVAEKLVFICRPSPFSSANKPFRYIQTHSTSSSQPVSFCKIQHRHLNLSSVDLEQVFEKWATTTSQDTMSDPTTLTVIGACALGIGSLALALCIVVWCRVCQVLDKLRWEIGDRKEALDALEARCAALVKKTQSQADTTTAHLEARVQAETAALRTESSKAVANLAESINETKATVLGRCASVEKHLHSIQAEYTKYFGDFKGEVSMEVGRQFQADNITPRLQQWRTDTDTAYERICAELLEQYKLSQKELYGKLNDELAALDKKAVDHTKQFDAKQKRCQNSVTTHIDSEVARMRNICETDFNSLYATYRQNLAADNDRYLQTFDTTFKKLANKVEADLQKAASGNISSMSQQLALYQTEGKTFLDETKSTASRCLKDVKSAAETAKSHFELELSRAKTSLEGDIRSATAGMKRDGEKHMREAEEHMRDAKRKVEHAERALSEEATKLRTFEASTKEELRKLKSVDEEADKWIRKNATEIWQEARSLRNQISSLEQKVSAL